MKQIGLLFFRPVAMLVLVMLVVVTAMPQSASAMLALRSDDFNRCTPDPMWVFSGNGISGAGAQIVGAYEGNAQLQLTLPEGASASFSNSGTNAPRVMTQISNTSFTVETKMAGGNILSADTDWVIQGLLFRDASNPDNQEWLRFDFNSRNGGMNSYLGYFRTDADGNLIGSGKHIRNVSDIPGGGHPGNNPVFLRVTYNGANDWTVYFQLGNSGTASDTFSFSETSIGETDPIAIDFNVTDVGFFVANSGTGHPASIALVDYFEVSPDDLTPADDQAVLNLTVLPVGSGTVARTACNNDTVTLTANPTAGFSFANWSGDATGTNRNTTVTMNGTKNIVANFVQGGGEPIEFDFFLHLPIISR